MINKEDKKYIELARKYNLRLNTLKCEVFLLFEEGYSAGEVKYILRHLEILPGTRTFSNTIWRYYYEWKKVRANK